MIKSIVGKIQNIREGRYVNNGQLAIIEFSVSVDRGNSKKRTSLLNNNEYSVDFYDVTLFGQTAISFAQYAQKDRMIEVTGRMLQEEFWASNQTTVIATDNPLNGYLRQLIGQLPQDTLSTDASGNIFVKGHQIVNKVAMQGMEYRWRDSANAQSASITNYAPNNNNLSNTGFGQQGILNKPQQNNFYQKSTPQTPSFGGQQQAGGFPVVPQQQPAQQFNQLPQQSFGAPQQAVMHQPTGFTPQQESVQPSNLPGFGGESMQPANFGAPAQQNGFNVTANEVPANPNAVSFNPTAKPEETPVTNQGVETNIQSPETSVSSSSTEVQSQGTTNVDDKPF